MTTKFKKSFSPMLICWNDIKIYLGFEDSYFVPPPTEDCGKEGGVCGHYEQVDDDIYIMMQFCLFVMKKPFWESRVITCNHP